VPSHSNEAECRRRALETFCDYSDAAIEKLIILLDSEDERVALQASIDILDRLLGKPHEAVEAELAELVGASRTGESVRAPYAHRLKNLLNGGFFRWYRTPNLRAKRAK